MKRKISRSSDDSVAIPMARSLGLWNRSQSRSSQNSLTRSFIIETVASESSMARASAVSEITVTFVWLLGV